MDKMALFAPDGRWAHEALTSCTCYGNIEVDIFGAITKVLEPEHDSYEFRKVMTPVGYLVQSAAGNEHLSLFCRPVVVDDSCDAWDVEIPPWPVEILAMCSRAACLAVALWRLDKFRQELPSGFEDTTVEAVLNAVVRERIEVELTDLIAKVKAFRQGREEPSHYGFIDCGHCNTEGCDECGGHGSIEGAIYG